MSETPEARAARRAGRTGQAFGRAQFVAARAGEYDRTLLDSALSAFMSAVPALAAILASGFPVNNTLRWVPVGPSAVRNRTGEHYRRSTGRVKDLAVSPDGRRAYAASATGGVWYTEDAGATWAPIGGWANRTARVGGPNNAQSCGSILVHFGADAAGDFVMVGTGMGDLVWNRTPNRPALGGLGVLAASNPAATAGAGGDPWEAESGLGVMEGLGIFRLSRDPSAVAGRVSGAGADRVAAATNRGLFLGVRRPAAAGGGEFVWTEQRALEGFLGLAAGARPIVTDVLWLRRGAAADGRIVVAVCNALDTLTTPAAPGAGVAYSDDLGATFRWVANLDMTTMAPPAVGRISLALAEAARVYVTGDLASGAPGHTPALWRVSDMAAAAPTATAVPGVPADLWSAGGNQRDWDQCIAIDVVPGAPPVDRVYLGGSFHDRLVDAPGAVWCLDVSPAPALVPSPGVSRAGLPPGGEGANPAGLVGDNIHPDIQRIQLVGPAGSRQVWVACDGGIYVSAQGGRVNTFQPRSNGLGAVEVNFVATHPTSSHYLAIGTQDNGRHMRIGDVVWEETVHGDGGGVAFHPNHSQFVLSQATRGSWTCTPSTRFTHPLSRSLGFLAPQRENDLASFYTGAAAVRRSPVVGRLSLGTNRVWVTDDLGSATPNTWRVLPYPSGPASDPRPGGTDPVAQQNVGLPGGAPLPAAAGGVGPLGVVLTQKWAKPTELLVLFERGLVRWTQNPVSSQWTARVLVAPAGVVLAPAVTGAPDPAVTILSDIGPVPDTSDFYLTTTGDTAVPPGDTCFFFDDASSTFRPTDLRNRLPPVVPLAHGPLDPAYAVVVDPFDKSIVYVGTVTGVWQGRRTAGVARHGWTALVNGLPQAAVQDLSVFHEPASGTRLLRAAVQARGVWELDIGSGTEPQRTYVKVHARDDRRRLPTPMANPRNRPSATPEPVFASPDIVVRPRSNPAAFPTWQLGADTIRAGNVPPYQLWTFQTAFRWLFPSIVADGQWTEALGQLVQLHRSTLGIAPVVPQINRALWDAVVGGVHLNAAGVVTASAGDPFAVYRTPWTSPAALTAVPTEIDLLESVVAPSTLLGVQQLFNEPSTVDVLIHHRDTRPLNAGDAFALLLWRHAASQVGALAPGTIAGIPAYVASVLAAEAVTTATAGPLPAVPPGWTLAPNPLGRALHKLDVKLDARMPRGVSIDVDLSSPGVPNLRRVLFLAIVGSRVDPCPALAGPAPTTMEDLVRRWPYAAMRLVRVSARPP
ncbi:MAG TPA: hypothetical protein VFB84_08385 [Micromonosporaceae bacterium]|nr:hypothetical protein [Micromonosporaceae bacterium]